MFASCYGCIELVRDLLAAGADKHAVNNVGTAHTLAGRYGTDAPAATIRALLDATP